MFIPFEKIFSLFFLGGQGMAVLITIFWLWVLVDCLMKEPSTGNDKVAWVLFILLLPVIGALVTSTLIMLDIYVLFPLEQNLA